MTGVPVPPFAHIRRLTDERGMFEHALGIEPRLECGYCLDDVARALIVACRHRPASPELDRLAGIYFRFIVDAQAPDGTCHNRLDRYHRWEDRPSTGDWWGRALWALGTAAARSSQPWLREAAATRFDISAARRSAHLHTMSFAALGAAELLDVQPGHQPALDLLAATVALAGLGGATDRAPANRRGSVHDRGPATEGAPADGRAHIVGRDRTGGDWPWPLPRLTYANAAIPEALIAAGAGLGDSAVLEHGLRLLGWLLDRETRGGRLSVTPVGGWGPGEVRRIFDQQPIEAAALADACVRAFDLTGDPRWAAGRDLAIAWFLGANDAGVALYDEATGGGYDALTAQGRNTNQGAESTLAMVSTLQHGHRPSLVRV